MADIYEGFAAGLEAPATKAAAVTAADSDLAQTTRAIYIGGAGDIEVYMAGDTTAITFVGLQAGTVLPIRVDQIRAASTATNIIALW
ncbi:MAG: hypothetical protein MJH10_10260 [Epibacterium sp.]|nr:hypothetical protein [Epibacterium sp.]NQX73922.1 hypothetical protein [Epibacterium sp.]